jgi:hypothetical protein
MNEQQTKIRKYLLDCIDLSGYDDYKSAVTDNERLRAVYNIFLSEYSHGIKLYGNEQKAFVNWLQGLPSCFNIDFENHRIIEIGIEWGYIPENPREREERKFLNEWWNRIYMGFRKNLD